MQNDRILHDLGRPPARSDGRELRATWPLSLARAWTLVSNGKDSIRDKRDGIFNLEAFITQVELC
jgi:hypothetical protein